MIGELLIAGIGNIFQSDDAFGVEVTNRLAREPLPPRVRVEDFGIRGVHLAYELFNGYDALIMVDAVPMGERPGTLAVIEPERRTDGSGEHAPVVDAHTMSPAVVLATLARLGGRIDRILVVGCQPATVDEGMGLSTPVAAVVGQAVQMCLQLASQILEPAGRGTPS